MDAVVRAGGEGIVTTGIVPHYEVVTRDYFRDIYRKQLPT
jgi:hypothetical protein